MSKRNILIIGATGLIGTPITQAIVAAKSSFGRIVILTSEATASKKAQIISRQEENGVEVLTGQLTDEESVKRAYKGEQSITLLPGMFEVVGWTNVFNEQTSTQSCPVSGEAQSSYRLT